MPDRCVHRWPGRARQCLIASTAGLALLLQCLSAHAQVPPTAPSRAGSTPPQGLLSCDPIIGQPLVKIPEIVSSNGVLRGTVLLSDRQERVAFRTPPTAPGSDEMKHQVCQPQYVRYFADPAAPAPVVAPGDYSNPLPGPTLRARVGDVVELTFLNQINPADFGDSIDRAENGIGNGCDQSTGSGGKQGYPANAGDVSPIVSTARAPATSTTTAPTPIQTAPATTCSSKSDPRHAPITNRPSRSRHSKTSSTNSSLNARGA
jgi:hypothetical protein